MHSKNPSNTRKPRVRMYNTNAIKHDNMGKFVKTNSLVCTCGSLPFTTLIIPVWSDWNESEYTYSTHQSIKGGQSLRIGWYKSLNSDIPVTQRRVQSSLSTAHCELNPGISTATTTCTCIRNYLLCSLSVPAQDAAPHCTLLHIQKYKGKIYTQIPQHTYYSTVKPL